MNEAVGESALRYVGRADRSRGRLAGWLNAGSKRSVDLVFAALLLAFLAPFLILVAAAIRLDSRGPALFRQTRMGSRRRRRDGVTYWEATPFRVFKFRSMYVDAGEGTHQNYIRAFVEGTAEVSGKEGSSYKLTGDPRITRVGRWIRRTSIDELPQLLNVIKGEMSLVGPRPVPVYEVEHYAPHHMERLHALPGMTGYWQVYGRGEVPFEQMMEMDIHYTRHQSLGLDLKLLVLTVPAVVTGRGAE